MAPWTALVVATFAAAFVAFGLGLRDTEGPWFFRSMGLLAATAVIGIAGSALFG